MYTVFVFFHCFPSMRFLISGISLLLNHARLLISTGSLKHGSLENSSFCLRKNIQCENSSLQTCTPQDVSKMLGKPLQLGNALVWSWCCAEILRPACMHFMKPTERQDRHRERERERGKPFSVALTFLSNYRTYMEISRPKQKMKNLKA